MERSQPYTIRKARPQEAAALGELARRAYAHYIPRMGKEPGPMLDDYGRRIAEGSAYVLDGGGGLAGLLVLLDGPDYLLLDNIAVDPARQGQGLGGILMDFAEAEARARGYPEIRLYTHETMTENITLYGKRGYAETHRVTEKGYARVYMRKGL